MNSQFGRVDMKSEFLKKKKKEKEAIEKVASQLRTAIRFQALVRRALSNNKYLLPLLKENYEKLELIVAKKADTEPQKFTKMMTNAIIKMPFFLQTLVFLRDNNYTHHRTYLLMLATVLTTPTDRNPIIRKVLSNPHIFQYFEFLKLVRFALFQIQSSPVFAFLVQQFVIEAVEQNTDMIAKVVTRNRKIIAHIGQLYLRQVLRQEIFIRFIVLPYVSSYGLTPMALADVAFNMKLNNLQTIELLIKELEKSKFICNGTNNTRLLTKPEVKYSATLQMIKVLSEQNSNHHLESSSVLGKLISIHCDIIDNLAKITEDFAKSETYKNRIWIENEELDKSEKKELQQKIRKHPLYTRMLATLDLEFYFGPLMEIFKSSMRAAITQGYLRGEDSIIKSLSRLFNIVNGLYDNIDQFQEFSNREVLQLMSNLIGTCISIQKLDFMSHKNACEMFLLELMVRNQYQLFFRLDDVEFVDPNKSFPKHDIVRLIDSVKKIIMKLTLFTAQTDLLNYSVDLLNLLYFKCFRTKIIDLSIFSINVQMDNISFGKAGQAERLLTLTPFGFSFEDRVTKLRQMIKEDKKGYHRVLHVDEDYDEQHTIVVQRGNEFRDAFAACYNKELRQKYKIVFINQQGFQEPGIDGGGIIKQFINRVLKTGLDPMYGLFVETTNKEIIPNPNVTISKETHKHYEFIGMLLGKALYENIQIEPKFAAPFLNTLMGRPNTLQDLQYIDRDLYKTLIYIKHTTDDVSALQLSFSCSELVDGNLIQHQLIPKGKSVMLNNSNKAMYVLALSNFKVNTQLSAMSNDVLRGFTKVVKKEWLQMFDHDEMNLLISGKEADFDVMELQQNTTYNGYIETDLTIRMFWEVLRQFSPLQKAELLLYVTSCSRPPTLGFAYLKPHFCIAKSNQTTFLPTAHTCMNILRVPDYRDKQVLRDKLLYAIKSRAGFEFQ